jgi:hypothetical protein
MTPDEILSSPPILSNYNYKSKLSKYMEFTYNNKDDITGQTEYTITLNNNYKYIVDILVVAGGGGSGASLFAGGIGGGGGAGGIVYIVNKTLDAGTYKIIVGNGGNSGTDGRDSMITSENGINIVLDGIALKTYGGQYGSNPIPDLNRDSGRGFGGNGGNTGNGGATKGASTFIQENTFLNGKSYVSPVFKGANGGVNYGGGGGGSLSDGNDIKGGNGCLIDIIGYGINYSWGGGSGRTTFDSNGNIAEYISGGLAINPGSGGRPSMLRVFNTVGNYEKPENTGNSGNPGIVIISYKTEKIDPNKNNNMSMYIGISISIAIFFFLVCVYLYIKKRRKINDDIGTNTGTDADIVGTNISIKTK